YRSSVLLASMSQGTALNNLYHGEGFIALETSLKRKCIDAHHVADQVQMLFFNTTMIHRCYTKQCHTTTATTSCMEYEPILFFHETPSEDGPHFTFFQSPAFVVRPSKPHRERAVLTSLGNAGDGMYQVAFFGGALTEETDPIEVRYIKIT